MFELLPDPRRYCRFTVSGGANDGFYRQFDGRSLAETWKSIEIAAADEPDPQADLADFSLLGTEPVLSDRAVEVLADLLKRSGEVLPLRYARTGYVLFNVTRVLDALDEGRSVLRRFPTGRVMAIQSYVFRQEVVESYPIFKITQFPRAYVFVTEEFVTRVHDAGLTGFSPKLLWEGEP